MSENDARVASKSCFWKNAKSSNQEKRIYPDRFQVNYQVLSNSSDSGYFLDKNEKEEYDENYRIRCGLFRMCCDIVQETVHSEIISSTNQSMELIQRFILSTSKSMINGSTLPICLVLLDPEAYGHDERNLFSLQAFCETDVNAKYIEINEMSGYDVLKEQMNENSDKKGRVVRLTQSCSNKMNQIKEIVAYCLSCRSNYHIPVTLLVEWFFFPEAFGNLLERSITANCLIQPVLFPSVLDLINNIYAELIVRHRLPVVFSYSFLSRINSILLNYDYSIWNWMKSVLYYLWEYFSYERNSVSGLLFLQQMLPSSGKEIVIKEKKEKEKESTQRYTLRKTESFSSPHNSHSSVRKGDKFSLSKASLKYIEDSREDLQYVFDLWKLQTRMVEFYHHLIEHFLEPLSLREIHLMVLNPKGLRVNETHKKLCISFSSLQNRDEFSQLCEALKEIMKSSGSKEIIGDAYGRYITTLAELPQQKATPSPKESKFQKGSRKAMYEQLLIQKEQQASVKREQKDVFLSIVEDIIQIVFLKPTLPCLSSFILKKELSKSVLLLSNRKSVLQGLLYPQSYFPCSCCKEDIPTSASEDITSLYFIIKDMEKVVKIEDIKKAYLEIVAKDDKTKEMNDLREASFWDSLSTLQHLGLISINLDSMKVTKLDFAIS